MSEHQEIRRRLAVIGKDRKWLAKQLKKSEETVRQYLQPKGKRTKELMEEIDRVIVLEEARQRENQTHDMGMTWGQYIINHRDLSVTH